MKSAKQPAADASSNRRSQPVRQTRTNPPRSSANAARSGAARDSLPGGGPIGDQPIEIFPAITHFADAITALPKELVRHFTLLKEVEAKIFAPEEQLFKLVDAVRSLPVADPRPNNGASSTAAPASAPMSLRGSSSIPLLNQRLHTAPPAGGPNGASPSDASNSERQDLLRQTAFKIQEMLVSLEEKNHVISTANEALQRQLTRVEDVWPYLENEFSDEAKWGSSTHWAYPENRNGRSSQAERTRRDGAAAISAAAQALVEQAAARSDARKQAVQAKRTQKPQPHDSDADDHNDSRMNKDGSRKSQPSKARKAAETNINNSSNAINNNSNGNGIGSNMNINSSTNSNVNNNNFNSNNVGLGISSAAALANGNPPQKRRKVEKEKPTNGAAVSMERATSSSGFGATTAPKTKPISPAEETPAPEPPKKRKALPTSSGQSKRKNGMTAVNPATTNSPVSAVPLELKAASRPSPPTSAPATRPASSRARGNSINSTSGGGGASRPPAAATASKTNGKLPSTPELTQQTNWARPMTNEPKMAKEVSALVNTEAPQMEAEHTDGNPLPNPTVGHGRRDSKAAIAVEEMDRRSETLQPVSQQNNGAATTVTTKSGRASKPSTPALPSMFQEPARPRTTRNAEPSSHINSNTNSSSNSSSSSSNGGSSNIENGDNNIHSINSNHSKKMQQQKKGYATAQANPGPRAREQEDIEMDEEEDEEDGGNSMQGDDDEEEDGDIDADEPTYCYCNSVSYGEMVACDSDDCAREWFHLACVGLKVAPSSKTKWYCEDCKERLKMGGKKINSR